MIVFEIKSLDMSEEEIKRFTESSKIAERLIACLDDTSMEDLDDKTSKLSNAVLFKVLSTIVSYFFWCNASTFNTRRTKLDCLEHFALVYSDKGTRGHILYADSAQLFHLEKEKIERIAEKLDIPAGVKVKELGTNRIPLQILGNSCGVHVAANCHAFLELGHFFPSVHVDAERLRAQMVTFIKKAYSVKKDYAMVVGVKTNWSRKRVNVPGGEAKTTQESAAQEDWEEKLKNHKRTPKGIKQKVREAGAQIKKEVDEDEPVPKKRFIDGRAKLNLIFS